VKELYCGVKSTNRNHFSVHFPFIQCERKIKWHKHQYYLYSVSDLEMYDVQSVTKMKGAKSNLYVNSMNLKAAKYQGLYSTL